MKFFIAISYKRTILCILCILLSHIIITITYFLRTIFLVWKVVSYVETYNLRLWKNVSYVKSRILFKILLIITEILHQTKIKIKDVQSNVFCLNISIKEINYLILNVPFSISVSIASLLSCLPPSSGVLRKISVYFTASSSLVTLPPIQRIFAWL